MQKLTPGEALDWARGFSHQALNVDYLIGTDGERYYPSDILIGAVLIEGIDFIADQNKAEIDSYKLAELMVKAYRYGEDGDYHSFKRRVKEELTILGLDDEVVGELL